MDFFKALQTAQILIDVIKALHAAITENTNETKALHVSNQQLMAKIDESQSMARELKASITEVV